MILERTEKELYISEAAHVELKEYLENKGYRLVFTRDRGFVHPAIGRHPDVYYCKLGPGDDAPVFAGDPEALGQAYPHDCRYNAACTGKYLIHRLDVTDPELLKEAEARGMRLIDVKQGYAKCSTAVVDETSIITYDEGIRKACEAAAGEDHGSEGPAETTGGPVSVSDRALEVLKVRPGWVQLPGMGEREEGFIGGASGRVGDEIVFNGDLTGHPDHREIEEFIHSRGLKCKWFPGLPLVDIGSII